MKSGLIALVEEVEVVEGEVARAELLARGIEVEVEGVDGVDLGEARVAESALDGALDAALLLLVAESVNDVGRREVLLGGTIENRGDVLRHAGKLEPAQLLHEQVELVVRGIAVVALLFHDDSSVGVGGGSPGSRVIVGAKSWS